MWADEADALADAKAQFQREMVFPIGEPNTAYAQYFIGQSYLAPISTEQISIHNVTFEPGCRNNWHIHHATTGGGQLLICVTRFHVIPLSLSEYSLTPKRNSLVLSRGLRFIAEIRILFGKKKLLERKNIALRVQGKRFFLIFANENLAYLHRRVMKTT